MRKGLFKEFLISKDSLWVYKGNNLLFSSNRDRLLPLLEYIYVFATSYTEVAIFDKIIGNAAALLCIKANCSEVYSSVASQMATKTLDKYGIRYHFTQIVPYIQQPHSEEMCPMETLSIDKSPGEFYEIMTRQHGVE
ncbi:DUF1893 domain-containing protein [Chloroflexota bacterium]